MIADFEKSRGLCNYSIGPRPDQGTRGPKRHMRFMQLSTIRVAHAYWFLPANMTPLDISSPVISGAGFQLAPAKQTCQRSGKDIIKRAAAAA